MLFVPGGVAAGGTISGSSGGIVASRNRHGAYFRNRTVPVNPNTIQQQTVRSLFGTLSSRWSNALTAAQRTGWENYAAAVATLNRIGQQTFLGGKDWYVGINVLREQAGFNTIDDAPGVFSLATYTPPTFAFTQPGDTLSVTFDNSDGWANEDDAAMIVFGSRPQSVGTNFFNGPYRFAGIIAGDSVTPPASPTALTNPFPFAVGAKVFARANVVLADGRIGVPTLSGAIAT